MVVYYVNDGVTETVVRNNGQQLGKGPDPTFDIANIDTANAGIHVFVGWTATRPATGQYAIWSEGTAMVSSSTIVHRSMELWPVYRAATVSVNSNIDKEIEAAGETPEHYRSLRRLGSLASVTLVAEAKDFPGYQFDHWATGYVDDSNQGTTVTDNSNFVLRGSRPFDGILYTAVYVKVHEVRYHDTQGNVIYTANVKGNERTFVHEVPVGTETAPDSGGGTTAGSGGTTPTQQVPIDVEAYHNIAVALDAAANADGREAFSNWQWDNNGVMVPWDEFFDKPITGDMDLYPVTWQVKATDAQDVAMTDQLTWAIDVSALETSGAPTAEGSAATPNAEKQTYPIQAYFGQGNYYDQKHLTVHVEKRSYKPSSEPTYQPGNPLPADRDASAALGKQVALYDDRATGNVLASHVGADGGFRDFQVVSAANTSVCTVGTDSYIIKNDGDALFVFGDIKLLAIVKKTTAKEAAGETFLFTVINRLGDGTLQTRSVSVKCSDRPDQDGLYTASVQLQLGQGEYFVREDESWAWRYGQSYQVNGMTVPSGANGARVVVSRSQDGSTVVCENKLKTTRGSMTRLARSTSSDGGDLVMGGECMRGRSDERRAAAFDLPHKRPGRKRAAVVAACALRRMLCCGGALAWFHTSRGGIFNMFKAANVTPGVNEGFQLSAYGEENVVRDQQGKCEGVLAGFGVGSLEIGASATVPPSCWATFRPDTDYTMVWVPSFAAMQPQQNSWIQGTDGLYYWPKPLAPESEAAGGAVDRTANLINTCTALPNSSPMDDRHLVVEIDVQAVQADPVDAVKEAWGPDRGGAVTDVAVDGTLMVSGKGGAA